MCHNSVNSIPSIEDGGCVIIFVKVIGPNTIKVVTKPPCIAHHVVAYDISEQFYTKLMRACDDVSIQNVFSLLIQSVDEWQMASTLT